MWFKKLVEKWKKCFSDEENKRENLQKDLVVRESDIATLKKNNSKTEDSLSETKDKNKQLSKKLDDIYEEIQFYKKSFDEELEIYELYIKLSNQTKSSPKGIFKDDTLSGFLVCGRIK